MRIVRRTTCRSAEAGGKTCALWSGPAATGVPALHRIVRVVLHVDRKRRIGQEQHSRGILTNFIYKICKYNVERNE